MSDIQVLELDFAKTAAPRRVGDGSWMRGRLRGRGSLIDIFLTIGARIMYQLRGIMSLLGRFLIQTLYIPRRQSIAGPEASRGGQNVAGGMGYCLTKIRLLKLK